MVAGADVDCHPGTKMVRVKAVFCREIDLLEADKFAAEDAQQQSVLRRNLSSAGADGAALSALERGSENAPNADEDADGSRAAHRSSGPHDLSGEVLLVRIL